MSRGGKLRRAGLFLHNNSRRATGVARTRREPNTLIGMNWQSIENRLGLGWSLGRHVALKARGKLTRWEAKTLQRHVSDPWGCHCRSVMGVADAQMVQLHSMFRLWLFGGRKAREKLRRGPRVRNWSEGEPLHQSSYGREALAKEPLRSLRSLCEICRCWRAPTGTRSQGSSDWRSRIFGVGWESGRLLNRAAGGKKEQTCWSRWDEISRSQKRDKQSFSRIDRRTRWLLCPERACR